MISDTVLLALIGLVPTTMTGIFGYIQWRATQKAKQAAEEREARNAKRLASVAGDIHEHLAEQDTKLEPVHEVIVLQQPVPPKAEP